MNKIGLIMMVVGLIGMIFTAKSLFDYTTFGDMESYPSESIEEIMIKSHYANVFILPSNGDEISIELRGVARHQQHQKIDASVSVNEQTGKMQIDLNQSWFTNISFFSSRLNMRNDLIIYLPNKQFEFIHIKNEVGKTIVKNTLVDYLKIESSVANMHVERVQANRIDTKNLVGQIVLKHSTGEIFAESEVGNISITIDDIYHDMELVSKIGKISLFVPNIPQHTSFTANTSIGSVNIFGENRSYINEKAEHFITLTTNLGNISVVRR